MKWNWISIYLLFACARQFAKNELKKKNDKNQSELERIKIEMFKLM